MLDDVDPEHRLILSREGRLVYMAKLLAEADEAVDQTDIKRLDFKLKVVRSAHEQQSEIVKEIADEALSADVRELVDQMKQDQGAQRLSNAPQIPRKDSASTDQV